MDLALVPAKLIALDGDFGLLPPINEWCLRPFSHGAAFCWTSIQLPLSNAKISMEVLESVYTCHGYFFIVLMTHSGGGHPLEHWPGGKGPF